MNRYQEAAQYADNQSVHVTIRLAPNGVIVSAFNAANDMVSMRMETYTAVADAREFNPLMLAVDKTVMEVGG